MMYPLGHLTLIEKTIYGDDDVYHWDEARRLSFQFEVIRESFKYHYDNCELFRRYAYIEGITPNALRSSADLNRIPLIPSSVFKSLDVRSVPQEQVTKVCHSSGTRGSLSRIARDNTSLERFVGSLRISAEQLLNLRTEAQVFNLGPDSLEAGDVWFSYVMSLLGLLRPAENYVLDSTFYPLSLIDDLMALPVATQPFLVGPPIFFLHLLRALEEEQISLQLGAAHGFVITAGGWKSFSNEQIDREEFAGQCISRLGIKDRGYVRDAFNMVELNTVIFECESGAKHVPPWLLVEALDPERLVPKQPNEPGLLAFYDPLPTSYPGFILSDDFGTVNTNPCQCGRSGPTMEYSRRVELAEGRGCALTMDRQTRINRAVRISRTRL